jgi:hypothetical protein
MKTTTTNEVKCDAAALLMSDHRLRLVVVVPTRGRRFAGKCHDWSRHGFTAKQEQAYGSLYQALALSLDVSHGE